MGGCGKSSAGKSNNYTPKKMMAGKTSKATSSKGGFRVSGTGGFGQPKVKLSYGSRGR